MKRFRLILTGIAMAFVFATTVSAEETSQTPLYPGQMVTDFLKDADWLKTPPRPEESKSLVEQINEALRAGDWDAAIRLTTRQIEIAENDEERAKPLGARAFARFMKEDRENGLADFELLVRIMPQTVDHYLRSAFVLNNIFFRDAEKFRRLNLVGLLEAHCTTGIEIGEKDEKTNKNTLAWLHQIRGTLLWTHADNEADTRKALADLKKAHEIAPEDRKYMPRFLWGMATSGAAFYEHRLTEKPDLDRLLELAAAVEQDENASPELKRPVLDHCCRALYEANRHGEAVEAATKAIELGLRSEEMYGIRAKCYTALKEHRKAVDDYSALLEKTDLEAPRSSCLVLRGIEYANLNENDEAIRDFDEALRLEPKNAHGLYWRAWCRAEAKNFDGVIEDCHQVISLMPNFPDVHMTLGNAHAAKEDYEKAAEAYGKAFELDPKNAEAVWHRANCYRMLDDTPKAFADFAKAAELDPERFRELFEKMEQAFRSVSDPDYPAEKAIEFLTARIAGEPENVAYFVSRAERYAQQKDWRKVIEDFTEALRLRPEIPRLRRQRFAACMNYWLEDSNRAACDTAVEDATKLLVAMPHDDIDLEKKDTLFYRGLLYYFQKEYAKSLADFEECMKEDGEFPVTKLRCALLLVRLAEGGSNGNENLEKALKYAEAVLQGDKENEGKAYFVRGTVYKAMGENEKSAGDFEKARQCGFEENENWFFDP